jgi:mannose-6-phosphate isomerase-like protein (cupin superfamily)
MPDTVNDTDREAYHRDAESRIETYKYETPEFSGRPKKVTFLARTPLLNVAVQTVKDGGENNLHYHTNGDQCYFVLKGRVRFNGPENKVYGEFGPGEGIVIPAGSRYWFEKVGPEDLEVLQSFGRDKSMPDMARINVEPHKEWMNKDAHLVQYEEKK